MAMATTNEALITQLYNGMLLEDPTEEEVSYWLEQLNLGLVTPVGMVFAQAVAPEFTGISHAIASMYQAAFGQYGTTEELMIWRKVYDAGLGLVDMGRMFVLSPNFSQAHPGLDQTAEYVQAMIQVGFGRNATQAELNAVVPLIDNGTYHYGHLLQYLSQNNGRNLDVAYAMIYAGINSAAPEDAEIDGLDSNVAVAVNTLLAEVTAEENLYLAEVAGDLVLSGTITESLVVDLPNRQLTVDGVSQQLSSGTLAEVVTISAEGINGGAIHFTGSSIAETYNASAGGDTIRGAGGNDTLTAGAGEDHFIFEATATENGEDTIIGYQQGTDTGDVLDFSAFLTLTNSDNVATIAGESTGAQVWGNGAVLVVNGYNLTSATAVAALFVEVGGTFPPLAAPTERGKAVVITADVAGDARIWYILNQTEPLSITADEITLVAELVGVNNLGLVGFDAANFA